MPRTMMALGPYRFSVAAAAYQTLRRSMEYRWATMNRVGRRPALQYVGPGVESIGLDGEIYPQYAGGLHQVARMRAIAGQGVPLFLVSGRGDALGRWAIQSVEETGSVFLADGAARKIEFRVDLKHYGEDFGSLAEVASASASMSGGAAGFAVGDVAGLGLALDALGIGEGEAVATVAGAGAALALAAERPSVATVAALAAIEVAPLDLATRLALDAPAATLGVLEAANAAGGRLSVVMGDLFGPTLATNAVRLAGAIDLARALGERAGE